MPDPVPTPVQSQFYAGTSNGTGTQANQGTAQNNNLYTPGQQGLQQLLPSLLTSTLANGQIPTSFTAPQQVFDAANSNFVNNVEPGLVAQYGGGTPQIASQQANMNQNLAAQLYQSGIGNYGNFVQQGINESNQPIGSQGTQAANQNTTANSTYSAAQSNSILPTILSQLLHALGIG